MRKELFMKIVDGISNHFIYFQQRNDALNKKGLSPIQKCTAAIRQLAYGTAADISMNTFVLANQLQSNV